MNKSIGIVARSMYEAEDYIKVMSESDPLFRKKCRVMTRPRDVYGYRDLEVHLIGRYKDLYEWQLILEILRHNYCTTKEVPDWR